MTTPNDPILNLAERTDPVRAIEERLEARAVWAVKSDRSHDAATMREAAAHIARLTADLESARAEVDRLREAADGAMREDRDRLLAIVDRLPKTIDGIPIVPNMQLYRVTRTTGKVEEHRAELKPRAIHDAHGINWPADDCYSTRTAALAAAAQPGRGT